MNIKVWQNRLYITLLVIAIATHTAPLENGIAAASQKGKNTNNQEANDRKPRDDKYISSTQSHGSSQNTRGLPDSMEEAITIATEQQSSKATADYFSRMLLPYFAKKYKGVFRKCVSEIPKPDSRPFAFVVAIGEDGKVLRTYKDIQTNIFSCMHRELITEHFPEPPIAPYYLYIDMTFGP